MRFKDFVINYTEFEHLFNPNKYNDYYDMLIDNIDSIESFIKTSNKKFKDGDCITIKLDDSHKRRYSDYVIFIYENGKLIHEMDFNVFEYDVHHWENTHSFYGSYYPVNNKMLTQIIATLNEDIPYFLYNDNIYECIVEDKNLLSSGKKLFVDVNIVDIDNEDCDVFLVKLLPAELTTYEGNIVPSYM